MSGKVENQLLYKLFLGFQLDLPLKKELNQSLSWNQAMISWQSEESGFKVVQFHQKEFVGQYYPQEGISMQQLQQIESQMKSILVHYCTHVNLEHYKLYLFAQTFVQ